MYHTCTCRFKNINSTPSIIFLNINTHFFNTACCVVRMETGVIFARLFRLTCDPCRVPALPTESAFHATTGTCGISRQREDAVRVITTVRDATAETLVSPAVMRIFSSGIHPRRQRLPLQRLTRLTTKCQQGLLFLAGIAFNVSRGNLEAACSQTHTYICSYIYYMVRKTTYLLYRYIKYPVRTSLVSLFVVCLSGVQTVFARSKNIVRELR